MTPNTMGRRVRWNTTTSRKRHIFYNWKNRRSVPGTCVSSFVPFFLPDLVPPYLGRTYSFPCRRPHQGRLNPSSARLDLDGNCQRGSPLWRGVNSFVAEVRSKSCRARGRRNELVESLGLPTKAQSPYQSGPNYAGRILKKVRRSVEGRRYGRIEEKVAAITYTLEIWKLIPVGYAHLAGGAG